MIYNRQFTELKFDVKAPSIIVLNIIMNLNSMVKVELIYYSGIILQLLQQKEEFSVKELIKATNLSETDFFMAVGWLACERKIMIRKTKNDIFLQSVSVMVE